jgi:hypothetical protein
VQVYYIMVVTKQLFFFDASSFFMTMCQTKILDIGWFKSWEALTFENNFISTKLFLHEATSKWMIVFHNEFGTNYY